MALDGEKRTCRVSCSTTGHLLFSGIVSPERARRVAQTLMSDSCFCGWGVRTVGSNELRYNPMSYHNGSVWPHDNAIIAAGLARYGLVESMEKVIPGLRCEHLRRSPSHARVVLGLAPYRRRTDAVSGRARRRPRSAAVVFSVIQSMPGLKTHRTGRGRGALAPRRSQSRDRQLRGRRHHDLRSRSARRRYRASAARATPK
jgi:hypothetical protein